MSNTQTNKDAVEAVDILREGSDMHVDEVLDVAKNRALKELKATQKMREALEAIEELADLVGDVNIGGIAKQAVEESK